MVKKFNFLNLSLTFLLSLGFIFSTSLFATDIATVKSNCKKSYYTNGTWKLRIDPYDQHEDLSYVDTGNNAGSAYYILRLKGNGLLKSVDSGFHFADYTANDILVAYPTISGSRYSFLSTAKAENNKACQIGFSLLVYHYDSTGTLSSAIDFVGVGYTSGFKNETGEADVIDLHNSTVYYYDPAKGTGAFSTPMRAKASLTRLIN